MAWSRRSGTCAFRSFFFQAEDGIRDFHVTGVQTCALPISMRTGSNADADKNPIPMLVSIMGLLLLTVGGWLGGHLVHVRGVSVRSEERRVGKERRQLWATDRYKADDGGIPKIHCTPLE